MSRCALRTAYLHRHWQVTKLTDANQMEAKREVLHRFPESQEIFDTIERNVDNMVSTQESQSLRPGGEAGSASAVLHILRVVVPLPQVSAVCMPLSQSLSLFPPPPPAPNTLRQTASSLSAGVFVVGQVAGPNQRGESRLMRTIAVLAGLLSYIFFGYGYRKDMTTTWYILMVPTCMFVTLSFWVASVTWRGFRRAFAAN